MIPDNIDLDISIGSGGWDNQLPDYRDRIVACFNQIIDEVPEARNFGLFSHLELSILLSDDQNIQILNQEYRGQDKATNVLAFPSLTESEIDLFLKQGGEVPAFPVALGDIIFALETIKNEAGDQGKEFTDHFCHLCIHGMLHLLGYDHIETGQRLHMEALEKALLSKLSIDDPYQD